MLLVVKLFPSSHWGANAASELFWSSERPVPAVISDQRNAPEDPRLVLHDGPAGTKSRSGERRESRACVPPSGRVVAVPVERLEVEAGRPSELVAAALGAHVDDERHSHRGRGVDAAGFHLGVLHGFGAEARPIDVEVVVAARDIPSINTTFSRCSLALPK